ncbi:MAG: efflux RND transporter periplasmic adaptor subunit [candidate division NC10 bacterium]
MAFLRRHRVFAVLLGLGGLVTVLVAERIRKQQAAAVPRRQFEIVVGVTKPVRKDLDVKLAYTADVSPQKQVAIFAKVSGYIKRLGADLGDFVREGQLLVEVEAPELSAAVEQARAAVGTAEANFKVAESNVESARANAANQEANLARARAVAKNDARNAARLDDLHERGLISAMDRDNSRTNAESSQAALGAAEAQLAVARSQIDTQRSQVVLAQSNVDGARASLKIAQTNLDNTRIVAPFSGYISARNLYPGAAVSSQAAGTSNSSVGILVLQDLAVVKVQVEVQERDISRVHVGSVARVLVDAYPGKIFEARATRIVHALDPRSRTLGVEMEIANREILLKPGMYGRVELVIDRHPGAVLVPNEAIWTEGDVVSVFVVQNGVVGRRPIATGVGDGALVEVIRGLAGDESVIVEGKELVREGQKVRAELKK